jgi:hypothetical protein
LRSWHWSWKRSRNWELVEELALELEEE